MRKEGSMARWANARMLQQMGGVSNQKSPSSGRNAAYATMRRKDLRKIEEFSNILEKFLRSFLIVLIYISI
jgi:hypothetical protein